MTTAAARLATEKTDFRPVLPPHLSRRTQPERTMATYWEKLRDPRWQKKRLEVMSEAEFACTNCGDTKSTLNVHHKLYRKGADPWEYETDELECLCEKCHEEKHHYKQVIDFAIAKGSCVDIEQVAGYALGLYHLGYGPDPETEIPISSYEFVAGLAAAFNLPNAEIILQNLPGKGRGIPVEKLFELRGRLKEAWWGNRKWPTG